MRNKSINRSINQSINEDIYVFANQAKCGGIRIYIAHAIS